MKRLRLSAREARAVLLLIPFIAALLVVLFYAGRSRFDDSALVLGDSLAASDGYASAVSSGPTTETTLTDMAAKNRVVSTESTSPLRSKPSLYSSDVSAVVYFKFDPNTVTYEELRRLGIAKNTAAGVIKYRERGKVFQIPEDFATCYGISDSLYAALKPYIAIADKYRITSKRSIREDAELSGGKAQSSRSVVDNSDYKATGVHNEAKTTRKLVDINSADSVELLSVRGIGPRTAQEIIAYRRSLGGFHSIAQLAEIKIITERNYDLMRGEIWADSCKIQKIDINFATPEEIGAHEYVSPVKLRKILRNRQLKGGWSTTEDMIEDNTLTSGEAEKLAPYLHFTAQP